MSEKIIQLYDATNANLDAGAKRKYAVEAALEIIRAWALGPKVSSGADHLVNHMKSLPGFANSIQDALEVPKKQG